MSISSIFDTPSVQNIKVLCAKPPLWISSFPPLQSVLLLNHFWPWCCWGPSIKDDQGRGVKDLPDFADEGHCKGGKNYEHFADATSFMDGSLTTLHCRWMGDLPPHTLLHNKRGGAWQGTLPYCTQFCDIWGLSWSVGGKKQI